MKTTFIKLPWLPQPKVSQPSVTVFDGVTPDNHMQNEMLRLEAKYHRALSKKEVAHELGISMNTLNRRLENCEDLPEYKELRTGRLIFPISAVATYLSQDLIKTA